MSTRPTDWSPFNGSDPCPGDPDAWIDISNFWWRQRNYVVDAYREALLGYTTISGEGNRIRRLEAVASDGASTASLIAYAYEKAAGAVGKWQKRLQDMQERTDATLKILPILEQMMTSSLRLDTWVYHCPVPQKISFSSIGKMFRKQNK